MTFYRSKKGLIGFKSEFITSPNIALVKYWGKLDE